MASDIYTDVFQQTENLDMGKEKAQETTNK